MKLAYKFTAKNEIQKGKTTEENLEIMKTWNSNLEQEYMPQVQDETIVLFLIACQNDIELTQETLHKHYKYKTSFSRFFQHRNIDSEDLKLGIETVYMSNLPARLDNDVAIQFFKLNDPNYCNFEPLSLIKLAFMLVDVTQEENPPNGISIVIDMKGFGLMHLSKLKPGILRDFFQFLQEGLSIRIIEIHVLNAVFFFDKLMSFLKIFMNSELLNKIKPHSPSLSEEEIFTIIPKKCLPSDYGGDLPSCKELNQRTIQQFRDKQHFWEAEEQIRKHHENGKCPNV